MAQCLSPYTLTKEYTNSKGQSRCINVPCGKCISCTKRRAGQWSFRLREEAKVSSSASFLTLTYEKAPISKNGFHTLHKPDFQKFMKRLRKLCPTNKLKYYACGEYGTKTLRPHYHAIIFNLPHSIINNPQTITNTWNLGHTMVAHSNDLCINYVAGYVVKGQFEKLAEYDDRIPEFSLMSKRMGLAYLTDSMIKFYKKKELTAIMRENGTYLPMPRYYKEIIFDKLTLKKIYTEMLEHNDFITELSSCKIAQVIRKDKKERKLKRQKI
jgi:hypothetical protein